MFEKIEDLEKLEYKANTIRQDIIRMLTEAGSGHSGGPLGMADVFTALYFNILNHNPEHPDWKERDRFILSNGHICPVWYATLARAGYFPVEELLTLRKLGTRLHGHPHKGAAPGIENSAGPLGQGISIAAGLAYAAKMDDEEHFIFCGMGDGELEEGQVWEAFMFSAKNGLDNLIAVIDRNFIQIDGHTEDIMQLESLTGKLEAFGWDVVEIDAHNMSDILKGFSKAKKRAGKPTAVIANTILGKGVYFMEDRYEWHGKPPTKEQAEIALAELQGVESNLKGKICAACDKTIEECDCIEGE